MPTEGFDLVTAHAVMMLVDDAIRWNDSIGLVYAQLLLAFQHLAAGGALVTSLRARPLAWVVDIVHLFRRAFEDVRVLNPTYQARRPYVYVVCRGFRMDAAGQEREECLRRLRACVDFLEGASMPHTLSIPAHDTYG